MSIPSVRVLHVIKLAVVGLALLLSGCLGIHAGALYDHNQRAVKPMIGVSLEGYVPLEAKQPSYGARTGVLYPFNGTARVSFQPEMSVPVVGRYGNVTAAAGIASGPLAFHGTACFRQMELLSYGGCGHWFSDGSYGADLNVSFFFPILFMDLSGIH